MRFLILAVLVVAGCADSEHDPSLLGSWTCPTLGSAIDFKATGQGHVKALTDNRDFTWTAKNNFIQIDGNSATAISYKVATNGRLEFNLPVFGCRVWAKDLVQ